MSKEPKMIELTAEKQAAKAIAHTLRNISERPGVAWYLGHGTQTYALLTEAHATLRGISITEAQKNWPPADQPQFEGGSLNQCPFCGSQAMERQSEGDVHHIECTDCHATGPRVGEFYYDTQDEARAAAADKWNDRQWPR